MATLQQYPFSQIIWTVTEDKFFKDEIILEFHSFVRIISGEMKVIQANKSIRLPLATPYCFHVTSFRQSSKGPRMAGHTKHCSCPHNRSTEGLLYKAQGKTDAGARL